MSNFPGESTFVLTVPTHSTPLDATIYRAERIDCVARLNTDSLIQAHFPGFLRNSQTWAARCGWEGDYFRYPPNLRLRCLLVLARYAAGQTDAIRKSDVEAIPSRSIERLEFELLEQLTAIAARHPESWAYDTDRCGATADTQPEWNIDVTRGLVLLYEAFRRLSGRETVDSLEGFPGRTTYPCVKGELVEWNSVHLYFVMPLGETSEDEGDAGSHWMTRAIKQWVWNTRDEAPSPACDTPATPPNVYDFARYQRRKPPFISRPRHTARIIFLMDPANSSLIGFDAEWQTEREAEASWAGFSVYEMRCEHDRQIAHLCLIKDWQEWEARGTTYLCLYGKSRIELWGRSGPGYPSVIRREDFDWLRDELARPRSGHASHHGRALAYARFRYGKRDLDWSEFTSGRFRNRIPKSDTEPLK